MLNEEISDELKAKYDDAAMDEYGKPFAELRYFSKARTYEGYE